MGELREGARQLLLTLGQLPAVREKNTAVCSQLFETLSTQYANYAMLGAADAHGRVFCSSASSALDRSVADEEFFRRAITRDSLAVGNYWVDPVTGQKEIHFAVRFADKDGRVGGVVFAGLDLKWLVEHMKERGLSPTASILIADRLGNIIARLPNPEAMMGKNMRKGHAEIMDGNTAGWEEAKGVDGVERIFGYVPAQLPPYDLFLSAGQSKAEAVAPIDRATKRGIALIGLGLPSPPALPGGADAFSSIARSTGCSTRRGSGATVTTQRVDVRDKRSEIGDLGRAFNRWLYRTRRPLSCQKLAEEELRPQFDARRSGHAAHRRTGQCQSAAQDEIKERRHAERAVACPEDRSDRPIDQRYCARLQQPADRHPGQPQCRAPAESRRNAR